MLPIHYIQKGLLFPNPPKQIISQLLTSFSQTLDHFYTHPDDVSISICISISLDCTDDGAEFVHASAPAIKVSDLLAPYYVPQVVRSFFPLNGLLNCDGHDHPVLGAQVTELADGVFVACSLNHAVADGTAFWRFFNAWSAVCRTGGSATLDGPPPVFDRWFPESCPVPIRLPYKDSREFVRHVQLPKVRECAFDFSKKQSILELKAKANEEMGCDGKISSLQAVLAHLWRSVSRARRLEPEQETTLVVLVGYRTRLSPPLPEAYMGNSIDGVGPTVLAGELESKGLGWSAWQLNRAIAAHGDGAAVPAWFESWSRSPYVVSGLGPVDAGGCCHPELICLVPSDCLFLSVINLSLQVFALFLRSPSLQM